MPTLCWWGEERWGAGSQRSHDALQDNSLGVAIFNRAWAPTGPPHLVLQVMEPKHRLSQAAPALVREGGEKGLMGPMDPGTNPDLGPTPNSPPPRHPGSHPPTHTASHS